MVKRAVLVFVFVDSIHASNIDGLYAKTVQKWC